MLDVDWVTFLLKLVLVPTFIGVVSLAGRRWGTSVSGWLIGLPFTSGPVAFFLALEQGNVFAQPLTNQRSREAEHFAHSGAAARAFAYKASEGIMLGIVSVYAFCVAYGRAAMRLGWVYCITAGIGAFFVCTFLLNLVEFPLLMAFTLTILMLVFSFLLMPRVGSDRSPIGSMRWDLLGRMVSATALVFLITGVAPLLGPQLTGLLSPFPIYATTLAAFVHRSQGGEEAAKLLRALIIGSFTFIIFFLIVALTIVTWGVAVAFLTAVGASFLTHLTSLQLLRSLGRLSESCRGPDR
jgi:hypothetical protein